MFAEARGLVPNWHPVYRDRYTIEIAEGPGRSSSRSRRRRRARLVGDRCRPSRGSRTAVAMRAALVVPAFNGRLFSPAHAPIADRCTMSDRLARDALLALSTAPSSKQQVRARIDYRDLGVEQLGAVYESVLDYELEAGPPSQSPP